MNFLPVQYCTLCQWHLCTFVQAPRRTGSHRPSCTAAPPTPRTPPPPWSSTPSPGKRETQLVLPESHLHGVALWHQHLLVYIEQNWNIRSDIARIGCWNIRPCTVPLLPTCTFPWMTDCTPKGNQYNTLRPHSAQLHLFVRSLTLLLLHRAAFFFLFHTDNIRMHVSE